MDDEAKSRDSGSGEGEDDERKPQPQLEDIPPAHADTARGLDVPSDEGWEVLSSGGRSTIMADTDADDDWDEARLATQAG